MIKKGGRGLTAAWGLPLLLVLLCGQSAAVMADSARLDLSADLLQMRYLRDDRYSGVQAAVAWRAAERHRFKLRAAGLRDDIGNPFQLLADAIVCAMTLGSHDRCDSEDDHYRIYREQALLYQYRIAGLRRNELWLGAGPGYVKEQTRRRGDSDSGSVTVAQQQGYGLAWDLELIGRGKRSFASVKLEGNNRGSGIGLALGLGLTFF